MKKIFYILAAAIVALGTVACENEGLDNINPNINVDGDTVSFVAGINRTDLDGTATVWDEDDTIVVTWNENNYEFKNAETGDKNTFKCTAEGLSAIVNAENIKAVYSNNKDGNVDSAAGVAGALLAYEGAFGEIAFEVMNAFLKFTVADPVTLTASEGLFGEGTELVISEAGVHYVAVNAGVEATLEYKVGESMGKKLETTFEAKKIYNLGNLTKSIAGDSNGKYYTELATAFKLAESGATITLFEDITLGAEESGLTIANGKTFTLDLNGKTISQVKECTKGHVLLNNNGTLTIEDNSSEKTGKIVMEDTGNGDPNFDWGTYAVRNNGTLTINGGTIETIIPDGISHCATALMLYAGKTTINDGNIICQNYRSIQGFFTPEVVINGGNFQGQVWMHETCSEGASLTINGGTFAPRGNDGSSVFLNNTKDIKLSITGGTFTTKVGCDDATKDGVVGAITGGKFTENALNEGKTKALIANGYVTYKDGENYVVATLQNAVNADAEEISVYDEIDLAKVSLDGYTGTIKGANENAVLNTRNYTGSSNEFYPIQNSEITFEDINIWFPTEDGDFLLTGIMSRSTLTFNNCDFEGQFTLNGQGTWTFNECNFVSTEDGAYASFVYGAANTVKFNTCKFSGVDRAAKVYGTGGTLNVLYDNCTFTSTTQNKAAVNVDANLATTTININNNCSQTGMGELYALVGTKGVIYIDGVQVAPISYVAKVGEDEYETFEAALTAAEAGSTIELLADIESEDIITINKNITINGNNKTINSTAARAINIATEGEVTIKNLIVVATGERAVNVITYPATVKLESVNLTASNYTVNVATSAGATKVDITNSTLRGLNTVNINGAGAEVTIDGCEIYCDDNNESEGYAALCLGRDAVGGSIAATNSNIYIAEGTEGSDSTKGSNNADGGTVTINGSTDGVEVKYAAIIYGDYYYAFNTVDEAIEFDKTKTIILLRDATIGTEGTYTIDVNDHELSAAEGYKVTNSGTTYTVEQLTASVWSIIGDKTGWTDDITMYNTETANVFVAYNVTFEESTASQGDNASYNEFKIRKDKAWTTQYGAGACVKAGYKANHSLGRNTGVEENGTYDIYFNSSTKQIAVMPVGQTWSDATDPKFDDGTKSGTCAWGITGSMNGWGTNDVTMYFDGTYWYAKGVQFEQNDEFKLRENAAWGWNYGANNKQNATNIGTNGDNIKANAKCCYDVYVSKTQHKVWFKAAGQRP